MTTHPPIYYFQSDMTMISKAKKNNPSFTPKEIRKHLKDMWDTLSEEERTQYKDRCQPDKPDSPKRHTLDNSTKVSTKSTAHPSTSPKKTPTKVISKKSTAHPSTSPKKTPTKLLSKKSTSVKIPKKGHTPDKASKHKKTAGSATKTPRTTVVTRSTKAGLRRTSTYVDTDPRTVGFTYGKNRVNVKEFAKHIEETYNTNVFMQHYIPKTSRFGIWKILSSSEKVHQESKKWLRTMESEAISKIKDGSLISTSKGYILRKS